MNMPDSLRNMLMILTPIFLNNPDRSDLSNPRH